MSVMNHNVAEGIIVERGIPMPPKGSSIPEPKYPWAALRVGDSFFVPKGNGTPGMPPKRLGIKCATRAVDGGTRVWRIA